MRKTLIAIAVATSALTAGAAAARPWTSINQRERLLDDRIDAGVRTGDLTRAEATRLRREFNGLERLEATYRRGGLSQWERNDLDRRFDALSAQIRVQRTDWQRDWFGGRDWRDSHGDWVSINQRQSQLDHRIDQGVQRGQLTRSEADRLRREYNSLARLEVSYRRGGLSTAERADLDRRFDRLAIEIRRERNDSDRRYGYNTY